MRVVEEELEEEVKGEVTVVGEDEVDGTGEGGEREEEGEGEGEEEEVGEEEGPKPATWTRGTILFPEKKEICDK